jgi:hypothetical protein
LRHHQLPMDQRLVLQVLALAPEVLEVQAVQAG